MTGESHESYEACKRYAGQIIDSTDALDETENGRSTYYRSNALAVIQGIVLRLVHERPTQSSSSDVTVALPSVDLIEQILSMPLADLARWLSDGASRIAASNFCKLQKEGSKHCPIIIDVLKKRMAIYKEILNTPEIIEENLVTKEYERMPKRYYPHYQIYQTRDRITFRARSSLPPSAMRYSQAEIDREKQWYLGGGEYTLSIIDTPNVDEPGVFDEDGKLLYPVTVYPSPDCVRFTKNYFVQFSDPKELTDPCLTFFKDGKTVRSYNVVDLLRRQSYLKLFTDRPSIFDCSDPVVATAGRWWLHAHLNDRVIYITTREGLNLEFRLEDGGELRNRLSNEYMIEDAEELLNGAKIRASRLK